MSAAPAGARGDGAFGLLVEAMLGVARERPALRAAVGKAGPDGWDGLVALARAHAVLETAHHALAAHGALDRVPAAPRAALREAHEGAAARNALLLADAAAVQAALAAAEIPSALVKGAALVAAHYPALGARHMGDVDLLVPPERVEAAVAVVAALGARRCASPDEDGSRARHAPPLALPSGTVIELHRRYGDELGAQGATDAVLGRARSVTWAGRSLRAAAPDDLLGVACHHVLRDHRGDHRFRLRHLADLAVLLAAGASPDRAAELPGTAAPVRESLALLAAAGEDRASPGDLLEDALGGVRRRADLLVRLREGDGPARVLRRLFLPSRAFMAWRYGVSRGSPLLPLVYLWRPLRGAWRLVTGR